MRLFVLNTKSESSDTYEYRIKHPEPPTPEEIKAFMIKHSCDKEEGVLYEHVESIVEIHEDIATTIPKISKKELAKWKTVGEL